MQTIKKWVVRSAVTLDKVEQLATTLRLEPPLAALLYQRGVTTVSQAEKFFAPSLQDLHDPFLMLDMNVAIDRIDRALDNGERIMLYGDYDVDGTSAVSLLYNFFSTYSKDIMFYIPDRYAEGYGISHRGIDYAADNGVKLIITVDCGIKATEEVAYAAKHGVDFIVTDHHLPDEILPPAVAVLDPKRVNCHYPFKELSGCGVAFKLVQAYCAHKGVPVDQIAYLLDLVVVSIAADIVPLVDENRVMGYFGLEQLNSDKANKGLSAIIKICGLERHKMLIEDIVFKIGPRINATGRMEIDIDHNDPRAQSGGRNAVRLLTAPTKDRALFYVNRIEEFNRLRKEADRVITSEARMLLENDPTAATKKSTIIFNPAWMKGVVGIVASRLIETYYRPTVVLTESNGFITGSARSVPGFDLYEAVDSCADLLENFGGHTYATGLTMKPEKLDAFCARFEAYVDKHIALNDLVQQIDIDMEVPLADITPALRRSLDRFAPFGPGNPAPVFLSRGLSDNGTARLVGGKGEHLKLALTDGITPSIGAIAFSQVELFPHIQAGGHVDVCYTVSDNVFQGIVSPQLRIKDMVESEQY
ncbi:MAG: single-stranded-DNA-specific exonuclease RecJ [Mucinivorans sp.]